MTSLWHAFDVWAGKTLFHPIIIRLCWLTGWTQHYLSRVAELVWILLIMGHMHTSGKTPWWLWVFVLPLALLTVLSVELLKDSERPDLRLLRLIWWLSLVLDVSKYVWYPKGQPTFWAVIDVLMLFVLYCGTIKTLPPKPAKEEKVSGKLVKEGA